LAFCRISGWPNIGLDGWPDRPDTDRIKKMKNEKSAKKITFFYFLFENYFLLSGYPAGSAIRPDIWLSGYPAGYPALSPFVGFR
jgi:hypothetical protein